MKELVFASANKHKVDEVAAKLGGQVHLLGLTDIGCTEEIQETASTLEGNALIKARFVFDRFNKKCFADDTGLEVEVLNGQPGVFSARYAGDARSSEANIEKLFTELHYETNRKAQFRTVICLIIAGEVHFFEGIVKGHIARERRGNSGFGYDPVFIPEGSSRSFAEMNLEEKNILSHRALAIGKMKKFLSHSQLMNS
ncbi:MAG: non-canonical purine NTP diphosphatase [Flavobacteriales bacterium]|nr:non-canonical purine NTP diphosphatase [Flavobacteriales bacterium]